MYFFTACLAASINLKTSLTVRVFSAMVKKWGIKVGREGGFFGRILGEPAAYGERRQSRKGVTLVRLLGVIAGYLMGVMGVGGVKRGILKF